MLEGTAGMASPEPFVAGRERPGSPGARRVARGVHYLDVTNQEIVMIRKLFVSCLLVFGIVGCRASVQAGHVHAGAGVGHR